MRKSLDTSYFDRRLARRLRRPAFRAEYERTSRQIARIDALVAGLDALRREAGLSKAELARRTGMNAASVRRLFATPRNPEWHTLDAVVDALGAELKPVLRKPSGHGGREGGKAA